MIPNSSTYDSTIIQDFQNLDRENFYSVVHFYEARESEIAKIDLEERFLLKVYYSTALFETGAYQKMLLEADQILEESIIHNFRFIDGEDVFIKVLYQKGFSLACIHDYQAAEKVFHDLVKIQPKHAPYRKLLKKCILRQRPLYIKRMFALGVFFYLLSIVLIIVNLLIVESFYTNKLAEFEYARFGVFSVGLLLLFGGEVVHYIASHRKLNRVHQAALNKQKGH